MPNKDRTIANVASLKEAILAKRKLSDPNRALLVGLSGIDGSGKSYIAKLLVDELKSEVQAVALGVDGWLNLPHIRFKQQGPAEHFYRFAIRFTELFNQLVVPLRDCRRVELTSAHATETATEFVQHHYVFANVEVIILEGIFLFQKKYRHLFDLRIWIECTFETALERALQRQQEHLPPGETINAYATIYFPAQRIHFHNDDPVKAADILLINDPRLGPIGQNAGGKIV